MTIATKRTDQDEIGSFADARGATPARIAATSGKGGGGESRSGTLAGRDD